jgi:hypothetical protein
MLAGRTGALYARITEGQSDFVKISQLIYGVERLISKVVWLPSPCEEEGLCENSRS